MWSPSYQIYMESLPVNRWTLFPLQKQINPTNSLLDVPYPRKSGNCYEIFNIFSHYAISQWNILQSFAGCIGFTSSLASAISVTNEVWLSLLEGTSLWDGQFVTWYWSLWGLLDKSVWYHVHMSHHSHIAQFFVPALP